MLAVNRKNIKTILVSVFFAVGLLVLPAFSVSTKAADSLEAICGRNPSASVCRQYRETRGETARNNSFVSFLGEVVQILLFGLGIAGVIGVISGGLYFVLSGGDPQKTQTARKIVIYSIVGVVVGVTSQLIITFVLDRLNL